MSKKNENNSIELERKKVSPDVLKRVKLFTEALNLSFGEFDDSEEEPDEEYQIKKQKELSGPKRMQVLEGFVQRFGVSLDYDEGDIIEVALFKAAMQQDQERFSVLAEHPDLHPKMKIHVLSYSVLMACGFRDIQIVGFLAKNMKNLTKLVTIEKDGSEEPCSPVGVVLNGFCNSSFLDRELINILLENGLDLSSQRDGYCPYTTVINSAPEEFSIEMLDRIQDINAIQYDHYIDINPDTNIPVEIRLKPTYYLVQAIEEEKFKLAVAMIKMGAKPDVQSSCGSNLLNIILACAGDDISENALEFIKYLFENKHVTSLSAKYNEFGADLLKFHEAVKLVVLSGLEIEEFTEEDKAKYYNQIKAKVLFEQKSLADIEVIKKAHSECNEESIKDSFLPKKTVDSMLKYYLHGFKSKFKEQIEGAESKFFTDLADIVVKHLKDYTKYNWPQTFGIAKTLVINNTSDSGEEALPIPKEIIGEIGEYVFWHDVLDSSSL